MSQTEPIGKEETLLSPTFLGLVGTQFLTAVNDNIFRWLAIGIGKDYLPTDMGKVLMAGTVCFVVPYILLAAPAGYLADRFSKRSVIVGCKVAEIVIMLLGIAAILSQSFWLLIGVVGLTGAQSALFSPAKYGSIPEILPVSKISMANGIFGLATVIATIIGMALGNVLSDYAGFKGLENIWLSTAVLQVVAIAGLICSLLMKKLPAADPNRKPPWDAVSQSWRDIRTLASNRALLRVALGMVFYWSIGGLAQMNIDQFAFEAGGLQESAKNPLLITLVIGVGLGSVLAGIWSHGRVELGIIPLGAAGVALSSMLLFTVSGIIFAPYAASGIGLAWACVLLFFLGASAGLFEVPLSSYIQHRTPPDTRGSVLAASNLLTNVGLMVIACLFAVMRMPTDQGSLDDVVALHSVHLSQEEQQEVDDVTDQFEASRKKATSPRLEDYLEEASEDAKPVLLANMLWAEFQSTPPGQQADRKAYIERFPDYATVVAGVHVQAYGPPLMNARQIFLLAGLLTIPVFIYIVWLIPQAFIRFVVWLAANTLYKIRFHGLENLPERGGALLVANHISWLDGVLLVLASSRPVRLIGYEGNFTNKWFKRFADMWEVIWVQPNPKTLIRAFKTAREALNNGELVAIFPEGGITRTGQIQAFRPGMMKILQGTTVPVVPVYFDELWGSIFSFERGRFFWKIPKQWPYPVSLHFGKPLAQADDIHQVRRAVQELGAMATNTRTERLTQLPRAFVRRCKQRGKGPKVHDSTGAMLTGSTLLLRTLVLRRLLNRHVLAPDEKYVGLLLPPTAAGVVANAALALDRKVAVNLNYTVSSEVMNACIKQAGIRHVLTSRKFMEKMNFKLNAEIVYLEDFREDKAKQPTLSDKLSAAWNTYLVPAGRLERKLKLDEIKPDDVLTVIFTSGSTGEPKGVMLTYANVASNIEAIDQVVHLKPTDVLLGVLPFFHSFGYTVTLWTVLSLDVAGVYHFSPLESRQIGKLCKKHGATVFLATPTFLNSYLRRCEADELQTLDVVVTGAERLPSELADAFEEKFGVRPVEGYGATELSPLVSVNIPPSRSVGNFQEDCRAGTVGRPVPGVTAKITHIETGEELGANESGMLWIKGPNVMAGYIGRDDLTSEVIHDGWYKTGDVALIDDDGFVKITGRESRFSKIGGEMVPHVQIEEELTKQLGAGEEEGIQLAVTAVPHAKKGERLVVIHTAINKTPDELRQGLTAAGLPNIFIPSADSFVQTETIPILGTGKLDLKGVRQLALEKFGEGE